MYIYLSKYVPMSVKIHVLGLDAATYPGFFLGGADPEKFLVHIDSHIYSFY